MKLVELSENSLLKDLKNPTFAARYLELILQDGSLQALLLAIRNVALAQGGIKKIADKTGLGRESLYKALSLKGNPQFSTLQKILSRCGLEFTVIVSSERKVA